MRTSSSSMQNNGSLSKNHHHAAKGLFSFRSFLNAVDYKGEHCFSCGHPWNEKGELHYKHCRFFVSSHLHNVKNAEK
jgi:hypothetical protein